MMSFLKSLFGGSAPKKPEKSALEQLEEKADILEKRIAHQRNQIAEQENIARTHANSNKTRALAALKRKKQLEEDVKTDEGILDNINGQRRMLEKASHNVDLLRTMAEASKEVKRQQHNLDINKIEDIVDEMNEQKEISEEISNILSKTTVKEEDDEALLNELNAMSQQELDAKLLQTETLPDVPKQLPAQPASTSRKKDEEELDELKNWASAAQ